MSATFVAPTHSVAGPEDARAETPPPRKPTLHRPLRETVLAFAAGAWSPAGPSLLPDGNAGAWAKDFSVAADRILDALDKHQGSDVVVTQVSP